MIDFVYMFVSKMVFFIGFFYGGVRISFGNLLG